MVAPVANANEISPAPAPRARVIVVDDDRLHLRALERRARDCAHVELIAIDNAIDALLAVGSLQPDLVVIDVYMPGLDGLEACRRIKSNAKTKDVQVVIASSAMSAEVEAAARDAGALRAIAKPFDVFSILDLDSEDSPPVVETIRGADLLVEMLEDAGVGVVFGLPGGAISPVHDALLDSSLRVVTTRHESGAMFAAAAYARASGKLGVVAVTSGPGVLNAMTGLASAWCDGVPLLLLVGEVPRAAQGKGVLQDGSAHGLQIIEMARYVSKLAVEVPRASNLPHLARRAITTAQSGRAGPVVMTLPMDVTTSAVQRPRTDGDIHIEASVSNAMIEEVAELLASARRPIMLVGNGARAGNAPNHLRTVAEQFACPVACTPKGKGVFPEDHPLALGVLGLGGHPSASGYLAAGVDVVIAIGTSLGDVATNGFVPQLQATTLVHVDIDVRQLGKSYAPTHAIISSASAFLEKLAARDTRLLRIPPHDSGVARHQLAASDVVDRIGAHEALAAIQDIVPRDTIYTVDSGDHFLFAVHYLETSLPDQFLVMTGLGSMGQSIGAAIGAQLAHPDRMVAAICGDGCFAMNAFEVATAVAEGLPIRVFVFNDERLGMVEHGHKAVYGRRAAYPTTPLDVCSIGVGLGAKSLRVGSIADLVDAAELLRGYPGPVVVDVRLHPDIRIPKQDRIATMTPGAVRPRSSSALN
jgi:acetolactate synthase I/II/III large subunit